ncbi:tripartite motif-containing protein 16-like [Cheilinus undulatus]|uniref:tripartite motif-containing protein 16-like n=1 Tax=Cheilinus undulatus TaxID=241271 RepID=UPI001BD2BEDB|nr:tripartite motif-containing protein 16-like [Cheilinus undulatus]
MAQRGVQLDREAISCSICLDLLKDPVTVPCGHSYCMSCIKAHWDKEDGRDVYSCPQCRQTFTPRPVLGKNTMLAVLVEELKKTGLQAAPADHCYAGAEDVACDVCTGRKLKAQKSCLQCLASFCEKHLQPHFEAAPLQKHKLTDPSRTLQENVCPHHDEVMTMFCRTDQQPVCYLCPVDEHKGHETASAAAERAERQREFEESRQSIQQRIQDREKDVRMLQRDGAAINSFADRVVEESEEVFTQLIRLMVRRRSDVKKQVRSQQETKVRRGKELQEKLEEEITELRRREAELEKLSNTEDHIQFLRDYPSLSQLSEPADISDMYIHSLTYFEELSVALPELLHKLQEVLGEKWTKILELAAEGDVSLPQPEPMTRAEFLNYARDITMDPNTLNNDLTLSNEDREITIYSDNSYPSHPDRFTELWQVLSKEGLTGRCYWEVEWEGEEIYIAVAYKDICREGSSDDCKFGYNDKSWALFCYRTYSFTFLHNSVETEISADGSSRIGVYLDHGAGTLSFYSVSDTLTTMTLLHKVQTTFTQPLYAGLHVEFSYSYTAEFCKLR